jgi:hypothetical protein
MDDKQRIHQKRLNAGRKAVETKGQKELNRAGQMAKWTKLYGNNDKENPYSKENYYPDYPQDAEEPASTGATPGAPG